MKKLEQKEKNVKVLYCKVVYLNIVSNINHYDDDDQS